jgi:hypothetical protein
MIAGLLTPDSEIWLLFVKQPPLIPEIGRHDTPQEKLNDKIRAEINQSHRFESFAAERTQNFVKW